MATKVSKRATRIAQKKKAKFDPAKNYQWKRDDVFPLDGVQYSLIYTTLKELALSPNGTSPDKIVASFNTLHAFLMKGVEDGKITELPAQEQTK